jgi:hypothetical protein
VAELAEAVEVELAQEADLVARDGGVPEVDDRGSGGLVVGDAAQQEEDAGRGGHAGLVPVELDREVDDLLEGPAVE